ncbi:sperm-associated antigen 4 protein isoform X8 [Canis lupus baileyi]|uniref:sperm-associated antigen 4 protein isoform X9 n=1 Tax=Canis lupus dingo TaxID=286419 RepID=UPI000DC68448|nr:sperm-associated antigen 4 protein isoform X9 [Canis lupus dingo]XP_038428068.1 sperm-associated antigen 4 protein isoform X8 [Canis lupus familiaris]
MRRSPRPGSATSPHKHTPNFYSDNSNSSVSVTSGDSSGPRSAGPGPGEPEGRRARGSSCGEPALSAGVSGGTTWAGSSRQKPAPRSHNGPTACGAATVRGGASEPAGPPVVSEEQLDLLSTLDLRQEMPPPRVSKSFLSMGQASRNPSDPLAPLSEFQFSFLRDRFRSEPGPCLLLQVLSVLLSLVGDVLIVVYREVCSIRFLLTAVSLLSLFLAALWWGLLYLIPPLENEPKEMLTLSEYHERVRSQGQQLQQLQAELDKLHKEVSSVRAANSEGPPSTLRRHHTIMRMRTLPISGIASASGITHGRQPLSWRASRLMTRLKFSWGNSPSMWRNRRFRLSIYRFFSDQTKTSTRMLGACLHVHMGLDSISKRPELLVLPVVFSQSLGSHWNEHSVQSFKMYTFLSFESYTL